MDICTSSSGLRHAAGQTIPPQQKKLKPYFERTPFAEHLPWLKLTVRTWKWIFGKLWEGGLFAGTTIEGGCTRATSMITTILGFFAGLPWPKSTILSNTGYPKMATSSRCTSEPMAGLPKSPFHEEIWQKEPFAPSKPSQSQLIVLHSSPSLSLLPIASSSFHHQKPPIKHPMNPSWKPMDHYCTYNKRIRPRNRPHLRHPRPLSSVEICDTAKERSSAIGFFILG